MFRRKWSGLPEDPDFPSDLQALGYFINEDDEIRSVENSDNYFQFFISRNPRWNDRQKYAMNEAVQKVVHARLQALDLEKIILPLSTKSTSAPHLHIFASKSIASATRVILVFGESTQDLGVLAHRVIGGPGGINKGSMVSVVQGILSQHASHLDKSPPAVLLANCGQLMWLPSLRKALSKPAWDSSRMKSAVHLGNMYSREVNSVPGNRTLQEHVKYIFEVVLPTLLVARGDDIRLDIIGVGDGGDAVERYLDDEDVWQKIGGKLNCMALVGGMYPAWEVKTTGLKTFLRERARNYALSVEPLNTVISGPDGNDKTTAFTDLGCPVLSSGEACNTECTMVQCQGAVLEWLHEVGMCTHAVASASTPTPTSEVGEKAEQGAAGSGTSDVVGTRDLDADHTQTGNSSTSRDDKAQGTADVPSVRPTKARVSLINTYRNPVFEVTYTDPEYDLRNTEEFETWQGWKGPEEVPVSSLAEMHVGDQQV